MSNLIDGKAFAEGLRAKLSSQVSKLKEQHNLVPGLAVVLVGEDPASQVYVRNKARQTVEVGMKSVEHKLDENTDENTVLQLVNELNADDSIHGILVQLPLPKHIDESKVLDAIHYEKDVDGFHITNVGLLSTGGEGVVPCTPLGCIMMLKDRLGDLSGLSLMSA